MHLPKGSLHACSSHDAMHNSITPLATYVLISPALVSIPLQLDRHVHGIYEFSMAVISLLMPKPTPVQQQDVI